MKTAEEILSRHTGETGIYLTKGMIRGSDALEAMEEYAAQFKQPEVGGKVPVIEVEEFATETDPAGNVEETEWIASWSLFPGMVVSASTENAAIAELMVSIHMQLMHEYRKANQ